MNRGKLLAEASANAWHANASLHAEAARAWEEEAELRAAQITELQGQLVEVMSQKSSAQASRRESLQLPLQALLGEEGPLYVHTQGQEGEGEEEESEEISTYRTGSDVSQLLMATPRVKTGVDAASGPTLAVLLAEAASQTIDLQPAVSVTVRGTQTLTIEAKSEVREEVDKPVSDTLTDIVPSARAMTGGLREAMDRGDSQEKLQVCVRALEAINALHIADENKIGRTAVLELLRVSVHC